jgi:purine-nucleoside/S-methyl-5'-thioadenosine phosphorylase / adenosine deaminase
MLVIQPHIFNRFPKIGFGFSTKFGNESQLPFNFNMSFSVGDDTEIVKINRKKFFDFLVIEETKVAFQNQVHGDKIILVDSPGNKGESDALITVKKNLGLAITSADCCAIFIYDTKKEIIATVHSGWRGTSKKILFKTIEKMKSEFDCNPGDFICYLSPSISQQNYEVGSEVAEQFQKKYLNEIDGKFYLDIKSANYDMLIDQEVKPEQIQVSQLCSFGYSSLLHSYRRDGKNSGRALGVIFMKDKK